MAGKITKFFGKLAPAEGQSACERVAEKRKQQEVIIIDASDSPQQQAQQQVGAGRCAV